MDLASFHQQFPDEQSCVDYFKEKRPASGMSCPKCKGRDFSFRNGKRRFYSNCRNKSTGLKSGTVMEHPNLPFRSWLFCTKYMTMAKKGVSAKEMQRLSGFKR